MVASYDHGDGAVSDARIDPIPPFANDNEMDSESSTSNLRVVELAWA